MLPHQGLDAALAATKLSMLNLPQDSLNKLNAWNIVTVGDIYDLEAEGVSIITGLSLKDAEPIWQRVLRFIAIPTEWGKSDDLMSAEVSNKQAAKFTNPIAELPILTRSLFTGDREKRLYKILEHRFGLNNSKVYTLEELGSYYGLTRERIRQLEEKAKHIIRQHLMHPNLWDMIDGSDGVATELRRLRRILEEGYPVLTDELIVDVLAERYCIQLEETNLPYIHMLMDIWGWSNFGYSNSLFSGLRVSPFWISAEREFDRQELISCMRRLLRILHERTSSVEYFDLKVAINYKRKKPYSDFIVRTALLLCEDIERSSDDSYQVKFHRLRNVSQMAYRILSEHGTPMSYKDIHKEMASRLVSIGEKIPNQRSVPNHMSVDKRLTHIGRSGQWALSTWDDVIRSTILELMEAFFHKKSDTATAQEVYEYVAKQRPVNRKSIDIYLASDERFTRVDRGLFGLSIWNIRTAVSRNERWSTAQIAEAIVRIFDEEETDRLPFARLAEHLQKAMGRSHIPYQQLINSPAIHTQVVSESPRRLQAVLIRDYENARRRITMRERVHNTVRDILSKLPDHSLQLIVLKQRVRQQTGVKGQTFYHYLSEMADVQKIKLPDSNTYICVLVTEPETDTTPEPVPNLWRDDFIFDIAISYAGKQKDIAQKFANSLNEARAKVFFDKAQIPDLVGRNLVDDLTEIYEHRAKLCVMLASEAYNESDYAQIERKAAQARDMRDNGYIIPIKLEPSVRIKGMASTTSYLEYSKYSFDQLVQIVLQALARR